MGSLAGKGLRSQPAAADDLESLVDFSNTGGPPEQEEEPDLESEELVEAMRQAAKESGGRDAEEADGGEALSQTERALPRLFARRPGFTLAGKSIYFLMTDRFARSGTGPMGAENHTFCSIDSHGAGGWCGGTFRGIIRQLPYIRKMGFDCIWISPPIDAMDYTGYFARNFFKINKQWGTQRDLRRLSHRLRKLGMCLVIDIVTNHVRGLTDSGGKPLVTGNSVPVMPFHRASDYHQLSKIPGTTFQQYVTLPPPYASSGAGSNAVLKAGVDAGVFRCGPDVPDISYCSCFPGNSGCECSGSNDTLQVDGWFGNLGDLNQSMPSVQSGLLRFVKGLRDAFGADALRLDTAIYQRRKWLSELQKEVGIEILGEATVTNLTYAGTFQRNRGRPVLKGLLNFPPFYWIPQAFCSYYLLAPFGQYAEFQGTWSSAPPNLTQVAAVIRAQQTGGMYSDLDLLGNFADNHDEFSRVGWYCQQDSQRIRNIMALIFFMRGIPIVYYGTEQGLLGHQLTKSESKNYTIPTGQFRVRESLWQTYYDTSTWQYNFITQLNYVRKMQDFAVGEMEIKGMTESTMVFTREQAGRAPRSQVWAFINNLPNTTRGRVKYCPGPPEGRGKWFDALSREVATLKIGCYLASDGLPKLLVQA